MYTHYFQLGHGVSGVVTLRVVLYLVSSGSGSKIDTMASIKARHGRNVTLSIGPCEATMAPEAMTDE